jgi:hypothetical protein
MTLEKLLVLNVRPQNMRDFEHITRRIRARAPDIGVLVRPGDFSPGMLSHELQRLPCLSVYLVNAPVRLHAGTILSVCRISKLEQARVYAQAGIDTPRTQVFVPGSPLDPQQWGTHVVLKPEGESFGRGVMLCPVDALNAVLPAALPADHPLIQQRYLVQQFIDTGKVFEKYRLIYFMGQLVLSYHGRYARPGHLPRHLNEALEARTFDARTLKYTLDGTEELEAFGRRMFDAFPDQPIQGLDVLRSSQDGRLYAIENNAGGNVWKFSDPTSLIYQVVGARALERQFNAWDRSADALIRQTRELAS